MLNSGIVAQENPSTTVDPAKKSVSASTVFDEAMGLYRERDLPKAMVKFKESAEQGGPEAAASYAWLARMQLMLGQPDDAAASADKALQLDKDLTTAQSAKSEVLYRMGDFSDAQEIFRRIVLTDKPDARAYLGLAKIHWATGNYKSAKQVIDHARNLDPKDPEIFWRWFATLEAPQQMAALQAELASATNPNAEQTVELKRGIEVRQEREKRPPSSCKLVSAATSTEIKLEPVLRGPKQLTGYAIPTKLNDAKAMLGVNTGVEGIIINARVAEKAGLQRFSENRFTGVRDYGSGEGRRGYAARITVGDLEFKDCYVEVLDHSHLDSADGLIGTDILEDFLVDPDFPGRCCA